MILDVQHEMGEIRLRVLKVNDYIVRTAHLLSTGYSTVHEALFVQCYDTGLQLEIIVVAAHTYQFGHVPLFTSP